MFDSVPTDLSDTNRSPSGSPANGARRAVAASIQIRQESDSITVVYRRIARMPEISLVILNRLEISIGYLDPAEQSTSRSSGANKRLKEFPLEAMAFRLCNYCRSCNHGQKQQQ